jgi:hypothetical protein
MEKRIGRIEPIDTDFLFILLGFQTKIKKNLCQSAQSAQSVFPLYLNRITTVQNPNLLNNTSLIETLFSLIQNRNSLILPPTYLFCSISLYHQSNYFINSCFSIT